MIPTFGNTGISWEKRGFEHSMVTICVHFTTCCNVSIDLKTLVTIFAVSFLLVRTPCSVFLLGGELLPRVHSKRTFRRCHACRFSVLVFSLRTSVEPHAATEPVSNLVCAFRTLSNAADVRNKAKDPPRAVDMNSSENLTLFPMITKLTALGLLCSTCVTGSVLQPESMALSSPHDVFDHWQWFLSQTRITGFQKLIQAVSGGTRTVAPGQG